MTIAQMFVTFVQVIGYLMVL